MEKHSSLVTQGGAFSAVFGGLTANEVAAYGGLIIGVLGLVMNWYYKAKEDRRADIAAKAMIRRRTDTAYDADS